MKNETLDQLESLLESHQCIQFTGIFDLFLLFPETNKQTKDQINACEQSYIISKPNSYVFLLLEAILILQQISCKISHSLICVHSTLYIIFHSIQYTEVSQLFAFQLSLAAFLNCLNEGMFHSSYFITRNIRLPHSKCELSCKRELQHYKKSKQRSKVVSHAGRL